MILQLTCIYIYCFRCGLRPGFQIIRFVFGGVPWIPKNAHVIMLSQRWVTKKHPGFRIWACQQGKHGCRGEDILTAAAFFWSNLLPTEAFERHLWCIFQRGSLALGFCAGLMAWLFLANGAMNPIPDAACRIGNSCQAVSLCECGHFSPFDVGKYSIQGAFGY